MLAYVKCTIYDARIIGASSLQKIYIWVDVVYAVNSGMQIQTGGAMLIGHGVLYCKSGKQKINVRKSKEVELVGVSNYLGHNVHGIIRIFGRKYTLYQDNQSATRIKNGRNSCTGNSRHVNIKYFYVKDRVDKGEIKI